MFSDVSFRLFIGISFDSNFDADKPIQENFRQQLEALGGLARNFLHSQPSLAIWDLQTDLLLISRTYHEIMNRNRKMIMISVKEADNLPGFRERTLKHPRQFINILTNYFTVMAGKGKLTDINPEIQAYSFISMNYGVFANNLDIGTISLEAFIKESVQTFTRGLTP